MDRSCVRCGHIFRDPSKLRLHQARKTPCDVILQKEPSDAPEQVQVLKAHKCDYLCDHCGRRLSTQSSLRRHQRKNCKAAGQKNVDVIEDEPQTLESRLATQERQMAEVRKLLERLTPAQESTPADIQVVIQTNNLIMFPIIPWDSPQCIQINTSHISAVRASGRFREYASLGDARMTDAREGPPYVSDIMTGLIKEAHKDPATRNVYLNPHRADQTMVHMASGAWEVRTLPESIRQLHDGVSASLRASVLTAAEASLPLRDQNALAIARLMYEENPDDYARRAQRAMAAHLTNIAPPRALEPEPAPAPTPAPVPAPVPTPASTP